MSHIHHKVHFLLKTVDHSKKCFHDSLTKLSVELPGNLATLYHEAITSKHGIGSHRKKGSACVLRFTLIGLFDTFKGLNALNADDFPTVRLTNWSQFNENLKVGGKWHFLVKTPLITHKSIVIQIIFQSDRSCVSKRFYLVHTLLE